MECAFDNDKFIALIEARPCLWDTSEQDYSNRNKKQHCWIEVSKEMLEGFEELPLAKQNEYGRELQKKWKNLRNCFARELAKRKNKPSGSGAKWKTYIFFDQLSFLLRCPTKETVASIPRAAIHEHDDMVGIESNVDNSEEQQSTSGERQSKRKCTSRRTKDSNAEILEIIKNSLLETQHNEQIVNEDEDRHFLLSLLGDLKKVSQERKMGVKLQIMQAINSGLAPTPSVVPSPASSYSNYYLPQAFTTAPPGHHSFYPIQPSQLHQSTSYRPPEVQYLPGRATQSQVSPVPKFPIPSIHSQFFSGPPPITNPVTQSQVSPLSQSQVTSNATQSPLSHQTLDSTPCSPEISSCHSNESQIYDLLED